MFRVLRFHSRAGSSILTVPVSTDTHRAQKCVCVGEARSFQFQSNPATKLRAIRGPQFTRARRASHWIGSCSPGSLAAFLVHSTPLRLSRHRRGPPTCCTLPGSLLPFHAIFQLFCFSFGGSPLEQL